MEKNNKKSNISNEKIGLYFNKYFNPILITSIILVFGLCYFLFAPSLIKQYTKMNQSIISEKKIELDEQQNILKELIKLNNIYESIGPSLKEKVLNLLPTDVDLANLYYNLSQLAKESNYEIEEIKVVLPKNDKEKEQENLKASLKEIKISLELKGYGYLNLKNFTNLIEKNLRIFDIESLNYEIEESIVEIKLRTYYYN